MSTIILGGKTMKKKFLTEKKCLKIREKAAEMGVPLYLLAKEFGYSDSYFSKLMREDFSADMEQQALNYINVIADRLLELEA